MMSLVLIWGNWYARPILVKHFACQFICGESTSRLAFEIASNIASPVKRDIMLRDFNSNQGLCVIFFSSRNVLSTPKLGVYFIFTRSYTMGQNREKTQNK